MNHRQFKRWSRLIGHCRPMRKYLGQGVYFYYRPPIIRLTRHRQCFDFTVEEWDVYINAVHDDLSQMNHEHRQRVLANEGCRASRSRVASVVRQRRQTVHRPSLYANMEERVRPRSIFPERNYPADGQNRRGSSDAAVRYRTQSPGDGREPSFDVQHGTTCQVFTEADLIDDSLEL